MKVFSTGFVFWAVVDWATLRKARVVRTVVKNLRGLRAGSEVNIWIPGSIFEP